MGLCHILRCCCIGQLFTIRYLLSDEFGLETPICHVAISGTDMGLDARKPVFRCLQMTQAQMRSLISTFVIRFLESITYKLATGETLIFLASLLAEKTGLKLALTETLKTGFVVLRPI